MLLSLAFDAASCRAAAVFEGSAAALTETSNTATVQIAAAAAAFEGSAAALTETSNTATVQIASAASTAAVSFSAGSDAAASTSAAATIKRCCAFTLMWPRSM